MILRESIADTIKTLLYERVLILSNLYKIGKN